MTARSYLYAPASNARILEKVLERGADAVILDLEDGVVTDAKPVARDAVTAFVADLEPCRSGPRVLVRINGGGSDAYSEADLDAAFAPALHAVVLPKAEDPTLVRAVAARLAELEARSARTAPVGLHLLVESAVGLERLPELARCPRVARVGFGAADFGADIGAQAGADHEAFDYARGRLVAISRAAGIGAPVDSVHLGIDDLDGLRASAERGRAFGFFGKAVIHPAHVAVVNDVYTPDDETLARARAIVAAAEDAAANGQGAVRLDGEMIDAPVVTRARAVLDLALSDPGSPA